MYYLYFLVKCSYNLFSNNFRAWHITSPYHPSAGVRGAVFSNKKFSKRETLRGVYRSLWGQTVSPGGSKRRYGGGTGYRGCLRSRKSGQTGLQTW
jgi:hypothetical protein